MQNQGLQLLDFWIVWKTPPRQLTGKIETQVNTYGGIPWAFTYIFNARAAVSAQDLWTLVAVLILLRCLCQDYRLSRPLYQHLPALLERPCCRSSFPVGISKTSRLSTSFLSKVSSSVGFYENIAGASVSKDALLLFLRQLY